MLPFVAIDESKIAPFHPYGVCVALAFFAWDAAIMRMAVRRGYDRADFRVLTYGLAIFGWSFAWGVDAIFYHPGESLDSKVSAIKGLSSTGAIVGAGLAGLLWTRIRIRKEEGRWKLSRRDRPLSMLALSEVVLATWPLAFALGRLGCALIHDHVGKAVAPGSLGALFAVGFPTSLADGVHHGFGPVHVVFGGSDPRYDLGLLELAVLAPLALGFALTWKKKVTLGTYTILACLVYGPFRFALDFLRAEGSAEHGGEHRIAGLTFAQYWSLAVVALGIALVVRRRKAIEAASDPAPAGLKADDRLS